MRQVTLSAPLNCQVEITSRCCVTCLHCCNHWRDQQDVVHQSMSEAEVLAVVRNLADAGVFDVTFTGGEPLMAFKTLVAGIEEAKRRGMSVGLNSNLIPLTDRRAEQLHVLGIRSVLTSFMGPDAATYEAIAQRRGSFSHAVRGILAARKAGISVTANMVVSKTNLGKVKETARFVYSLGVKKFSATKVGHPSYCGDFSGHALSPEEFHQYLQDLADVRKELGIEVMSLVSYPLCGVGDLAEYDFVLGRRCTGGISTISIGSDGSVRPCPHSDESYGNILTDDFSGIWRSMGEYRSDELHPAECKACKLYNKCGGGCRVEAKLCHGSTRDPDPYWCPHEAERALSSMKSKPIDPGTFLEGEDDQFLILECRTRDESFGLTIMAGRAHIHLGRGAAHVFRQLETGTTYPIEGGSIDWGSADPKALINDLIQRGVARKVHHVRPLT